jgi:hypothetical protein
MTSEAFIAKWSKVELTERSAAQAHFLDLCELVGHPKPQEADPTGECFSYGNGVKRFAQGLRITCCLWARNGSRSAGEIG